MYTTSHATSNANKADLRTTGINPNFWYPLAIAKTLSKGDALATTFAGEPIVLVRPKNDKLYALEDRCAHKQMPLSNGVVVGDSLRCCYHAWTYDQCGACTIPYLPEGAPQPRGVRTYPIRHAHGLLFVFPGDPALADTVSLPDFPECRSRKFMTIRFKRLINCHYTFLHENLMDMTHQFLHRRWMGTFSPRPLEVRKGRDHIEVDYTAELAEGGLVLRTLPSLILNLQRIAAPNTVPQGVQVPNDLRSTHARDFVTIATQYPYQTLLLRRPGLDEPLLKLWLAYVPVDRAQNISQPTGLLIVRKPSFPGLLCLLRPLFLCFANAIFREDRRALEAEQRAYDLQGSDWNQEILPFMLDLREILISQGVHPGVKDSRIDGRIDGGQAMG